MADKDTNTTMNTGALRSRLGNVVALTDSSGTVVNTYQHEPYGTNTASTGTRANAFKFGGS